MIGSCHRVAALTVLGAGATSGADRPPPGAAAAPAAAAGKPTAEMASHDEPALFKARVNLVMVPVVVRDRKGNAVGNLKQEDFQLFDKGKPQYIARFSMETGRGAADQSRRRRAGGPTRTSWWTRSRSELPDRFIAYLFDDVHMKFGDLAHSRDAAGRHIDSELRTTDRAAIYTTSGQTIQDFTDDRKLLHEALGNLRMRPVTGQGSAIVPEHDVLHGGPDPEQARPDGVGCGDAGCDVVHEPGSVAICRRRSRWPSRPRSRN